MPRRPAVVGAVGAQRETGAALRVRHVRDKGARAVAGSCPVRTSLPVHGVIAASARLGLRPAGRPPSDTSSG